MNRLTMQSKDGVQDNLAKLAALFPNVITEYRDGHGRVRLGVDYELLKQELSDTLVEGDQERYQLTWPGKKRAVLKANAPIDLTLRPIPEDGLDWDRTQNLYIEGNNLFALKLLQESYLNAIKCIYIDPPYNTGKDFIYVDDFAESVDAYLKRSGQVDEDGNRLVLNTESDGRFHSNWLSMMYSRLKLAKNLLAQDGVLFVSIDDNELDNLLKLGREVFGDDNLINTICVKMSEVSGKKMAHVEKRLPKIKEYVVMFRKTNVKLHPILVKKEQWDDEYSQLFEGLTPEDRDFIKRVSEQEDEIAEEALEKIDAIFARVTTVSVVQKLRELGIDREEDILQWKMDNAYRIFRTASSSSVKALTDEKKERCPQTFFSVLSKRDGLLYVVKSDYNPTSTSPRVQVLFADEYLESYLGDMWIDINTTGLEFEGDVDFKNGKKPLKLIERLIDLVCDPHEGHIVLDFFSGSATTAEAVLQRNAADGGNRRFILVQLQEDIDEALTKADKATKQSLKSAIAFLDSIGKPHTINEIGKERIRRAAKRIRAGTGADIDYGFRVFRVDSSNMKDVFYAPDKLGQLDLDALASNIKEDRTGLDLLVQVMLETGLDLSLPMETRTIEGKTVHCVAGDALLACFDDDIGDDVVKKIAAERPRRVVFRDSSFRDDASRINVEELFKMLSPGTEIQVL